MVQDDQRYNEFKAFQTVENEREANNQDEHSVINDDVLGLYNLLIEKYMPVTGIKNILVNSNFTQQITGFNSNVNGSGTTHITDLYDYYSTSNTKTNIYKNYSSELKGNYLNVSSTEAKGYNTSYIETFSLIPFDCEGFNYTFSFKARNIKNTKKLRVTIYNVNNSYTQDVTLNSFFQTYNFKVNKALPISNGLQNKIYVKIEFANNDIYADANLEFDIACLQITKGANYYTYLPKSLDTDCEEIKNYYIKFVACGLMPYYSQKAATMYTLNLMLYRVANYYLKNFDYESGIRMYEILTDSEGYITKKEFKNFKTMSGNYKGHYMFKLYINSIDGSDLPPNLMLDHVEDSTTAYFEIN